MKGYKGFNKGLICRGKQYAENTVFEEDDAIICEKGMHFCVDPLEVLNYYPMFNEKGEENEFAEVEALDDAVTDDGKKYASKKLKILKKINIDELFAAATKQINMTVESYYESDQIPTKEELEYLDKLGLNFTEFAAHYEVVTLDAPNGEICTVDSTCNLEEALKWYNEEINGFVYIQHVDHNSMLIEILKCNF